MNKIVVSGNLTKDPERVSWGKGKEKEEGIAFTIADNQSEEKCLYWDCLVTGKRCDFIEEHFEKGSHITVVGRAGFKVTEGKKETYVNPRIEFITDITF